MNSGGTAAVNGGTAAPLRRFKTTTGSSGNTLRVCTHETFFRYKHFSVYKFEYYPILIRSLFLIERKKGPDLFKINLTLSGADTTLRVLRKIHTGIPDLANGATIYVDYSDEEWFALAQCQSAPSGTVFDDLSTWPTFALNISRVTFSPAIAYFVQPKTYRR